MWYRSTANGIDSGPGNISSALMPQFPRFYMSLNYVLMFPGVGSAFIAINNEADGVARMEVSLAPLVRCFPLLSVPFVCILWIFAHVCLSFQQHQLPSGRNFEAVGSHAIYYAFRLFGKWPIFRPILARSLPNNRNA